MLNPHGKHQLLRVVLLGALLYALALGLTWATDEADASWGQRAARLGALGPLIAGISTWLVGQLGRSRGEARALLALGLSPMQLERGAVCAGWLLALVGLCVALGPWATQQSLFPAFESGRNWMVLADGSLLDPLGARYSTQQGLALTGGQAPPSRLSYRLATLGFLLPLVVSVPPWVVDLRPSLARFGRALAALLVSSGAALWLLHGVASARLPWPVLVLTPLPLLVEFRLRGGLPS